MHSTPRFARITLVAAALAAWLSVSGCASFQTPRIDPSGERILTWAPQPAPLATAPGTAIPAVAAPGLTLVPTRMVAPVGSEVLMVAGVHGPGQPMLAGQRVEWMLAPGSVGHFLAVGESERPALLRFGNPPQKVSNDYAVSETQSTARIITRGTVDPSDDVSVLPGQAWITLASPVEGSSHVTAFAPDVQGVLSNRQSGVIHWVDVRWTAPSSASVPVGGKHTLATAVTRQSSGAPLPGYKVRYEVVAGPAAGFGPGLAGGVELTTNAQGLASAELVQGAAEAGVTQINVQLVRPEGIAPGANEPLVLGNATITAAWTDATAAPPLLPGTAVPSAGAISPAVPRATVPPSGSPPASSGAQAPAPASPTPPAGALAINIVGPDRPVQVGSRAEFQIDITNRSAVTVRNVNILDRFGPGLKHDVAESPIKPKQDIRELSPGQTHSLKLTFTAVAPGRQCHTVEVTADGGVSATGEGCVTATAPAAEPSATTQNKLSLVVSDLADPVPVGTRFRYHIEVRNDGTFPQRDVVLSVAVPDSLRIEQVTAQAKDTRVGQSIRFAPVLSLAPGTKIAYELDVIPTRAGEALLRANATSQAIQDPVTAEEGTRVFDAAPVK